MTSYILDTNIILRYLRNDVPSQATRIESLFHTVQKKESAITVTPVVIVEAAFVLLKLYKESKHAIVTQLLVFVDDPMIDIVERSILHEALNQWDSGSVSLVDCYVLSLAQVQDKVVFTFDKKLAKMAQQGN